MNPFSKKDNPPVVTESAIIPDLVPDFTVPDFDLNNKSISNETKACLVFLHNEKNGIVCTAEEITQLNNINDKAQKVQWMKEKIYQTSLSKVDESISKTLDEADVFKSIKDPLEISTDELESMMSFKSDEEQKAELQEVISKAKRQLMRTVTADFISQRNKRRSDGTLDDFLSIDEMREVERKVELELKSAQYGRSGVRDAAKLSGVVNTLNEMSVESRYAYEGYKEGVCNDFGVTPESFDEWFAAVQADNMKKLDEDGITIRTQLYNVKEFQIKHKGLLRKVPGWKKGDIVYVSEFNNKVRELEAKEMEESVKHATPEGKQLFQEMVTDTFHSPDNPVKLKKSLVGKEETKTFLRKRANRKKPLTVKPEETPVKIEAKIDKSFDLDSFVTETQRDNVTSIHIPVENIEPKEPMFEQLQPTDTEVVVSGSFEKVDGPDVVAMGERMNVKTGEIERVPLSEILKHDEPAVDPYVKKYLDMGLNKEQAELLANNDRAKENKLELEPESEEISREFVTVTPAKPGRYDNIDKTADDYCKLIETEADPSILRSTSNRLEAIKKYKDSAKRGRMLYLPNSNYEVYVKKIRSTESIGYMITLLNNMKDMNLVEAYVKSEVLRILYDNIEFNFPEPVSYDDFVRCLHESDMTILMLMLALVNIPENKNGEVPLTIKSVMCTNPDCQAIGNLKEELTLDLKQEFTLIYPVELYATKYANYKNANYPTIYHAYRASEVGKMERFIVKDDMFEFNCICSAPTVFKTQAIKAAREEVSYKRLMDRIDDRIEAFKSAGEIFDDVKDYLDNHTYQDYARDLSEVAYGEEEVDTRIKVILTTIGDELENIKKEDLPFYLIMDVIDQITMSTLDGVEVVDKLDQKDVFTMLGILAKDCPKELLDRIIEVKNGSLDKAFPVDITFTSEELAGSFDFDGYYGTDEEMVEEIKSRYEGRNMSEEDLEKVIEGQRKIRNEHKPKYEEHAECFCGNKEWKLNYTAILFFWTSNLSQTLLK